MAKSSTSFKKGNKCGRGRPRGSQNKFSEIRMIELARREGMLPTDYLLGLLREENTPTRLRILASQIVLPYVQRKLLPKSDEEGETAEDRAAKLRDLARQIDRVDNGEDSE